MQVNVCGNCRGIVKIGETECEICGKDFSYFKLYDTDSLEWEEDGIEICCENCESRFFVSDTSVEYFPCMMCRENIEVKKFINKASDNKETETSEKNETETRNKTEVPDKTIIQAELECEKEIIQREVPTLEKKERKKTDDYYVVLTNILDDHEIKIPQGNFMLGAKGDIDSDYFWPLQYVGGYHLVIKVSGKEVYIKDNESKNKTYINSGEALVPYEKYRVFDGDIIQMADQRFKVKICK